jgi:hypothetical protein
MRIENRNMLSFVMQVCPEQIFGLLGFKIGVKVFSGGKEDVSRSVLGNWYKNKEVINSDENRKKCADIGQHQDCLKCIEVGRKNTFLRRVSLLTI